MLIFQNTKLKCCYSVSHTEKNFQKMNEDRENFYRVIFFKNISYHNMKLFLRKGWRTLAQGIYTWIVLNNR